MSTATYDFVFAFTENMRDCLLCSLEYFNATECRAFADRRPYPIIHNINVETFEAAQARSIELLEEFALAVKREEDSEPPTEPGVVGV